MYCEICEKTFILDGIGSGGKNRKTCFQCIPSGLSRSDRNKLRYSLLSKKSFDLKLKIGCNYCGYRKCPHALEWHHSGDTKNYDPSYALSKSWDSYKDEISKCVLLCANCHREEHWIR